MSIAAAAKGQRTKVTALVCVPPGNGVRGAEAQWHMGEEKKTF